MRNRGGILSNLQVVTPSPEKLSGCTVHDIIFASFSQESIDMFRFLCYDIWYYMKRVDFFHRFVFPIFWVLDEGLEYFGLKDRILHQL